MEKKKVGKVGNNGSLDMHVILTFNLELEWIGEWVFLKE
jgi:hypothetical protein